MDKSSTTVLLLLASSSVVLTLCICIGIYISNQPQLQFLWLFSSSHPILALNLLILLIIVSSHCFAISRNSNSADQHDDRDQLLLPGDSEQRIIPLSPSSEAERIADAPPRKTKKQKTLENTWKESKEGSHLGQPKHSYITKEDIVPPEMMKEDIVPPEMLTECSNDEVTSSAPSSSSRAKLRKEVSLSKEEVNRRVERFIRKFNDD